MSKEKKDFTHILSELSVDDVKKVTTQLACELHDFLETKKAETIIVKNKYKHHIKEHPFCATITALAIGALIGVVIKKL